MNSHISGGEARFDVVAVSIASGAERVIARGKTADAAEGIIAMTVKLRGVTDEYFTTRPAVEADAAHPTTEGVRDE